MSLEIVGAILVSSGLFGLMVLPLLKDITVSLHRIADELEKRR